MRDDRFEARRIAAELAEPVADAGELARRLGLEPYPVNYWVVDHDEMNGLIAYDGFQTRYPHWRWGMKYDQQRKKGKLGLGKAFEIVNNDDPSHAFLQESNTLADQKAVITHVEAHADFFANNEWFDLFVDGHDRDDKADGGPNAAAMLERHAETVRRYAEDPDIGREAVERFIDAVLCLTDTIDQHAAYAPADVEDGEETDVEKLRERLDDMALSAEVQRQVFDDEWLDAHAARVTDAQLDDPERDVLAYLREHGKQYDEAAERAVEMEPWQTEVLELLRREAYYFAGQRMTKVMNEGWASFWESLMMADENFADGEEFLTYADHMARVLGSPGLNPYKLGRELWEHIENTTNRREVAKQLLRVDGITPSNFHEAIDFDEVRGALEPPPAIAGAGPDRLDELAAMADGGDERVDPAAVDRAQSHEIDVERYPWRLLTYDGLAARHYSLVKPQYRGFVERIDRTELTELARYAFDADRYTTVNEALAAVDRTAGWDRLFEVRENHNDVTFIDAFLSEEFVCDNHYFTYEYAQSSEDYRVTSTDYQDIKRKLLLQFTNFGKPTVYVYDGNFDNRGELLLGHRYNGVVLDIEQAKRVLERSYELWGRPVNLMTIVKEYEDHDVEIARRRNREPTAEERGVRVRYDGDEFEEHDLDPDLEERIAADAVDYDTKPDEWLV